MPEPSETILRSTRDDVSQIKDDMAGVKERLGLLEAGYVSVSRRVDRIGCDVERIKVRPEAPAGRPDG
jgi:hypothetical protein